MGGWAVEINPSLNLRETLVRGSSFFNFDATGPRLKRGFYNPYLSPMKFHPLGVVLALALSMVSPALAAETSAKPAATNPAAFKGAFTGKWQGQNSTGGVLKLDFKSGADSKLGADVLFVYEGTDVRAQTKSLKVEGDQIELVITWEIQGTAASTKLVGSPRAMTSPAPTRAPPPKSQPEAPGSFPGANSRRASVA